MSFICQTQLISNSENPPLHLPIGKDAVASSGPKWNKRKRRLLNGKRYQAAQITTLNNLKPNICGEGIFLVWITNFKHYLRFTLVDRVWKGSPINSNRKASEAYPTGRFRSASVFRISKPYYICYYTSATYVCCRSSC
jgi:hypothetical protein